jgi:hypothetical protein
MCLACSSPRVQCERKGREKEKESCPPEDQEAHWCSEQVWPASAGRRKPSGLSGDPQGDTDSEGAWALSNHPTRTQQVLHLFLWGLPHLSRKGLLARWEERELQS